MKVTPANNGHVVFCGAAGAGSCRNDIGPRKSTIVGTRKAVNYA